jgi:hypothetical protein
VVRLIGFESRWERQLSPAIVRLEVGAEARAAMTLESSTDAISLYLLCNRAYALQ